MTNEEILVNAPEDCFAVDHFMGSKHPVYICSTKDGFVAIHKGVKIGTSPKDYPFSVRFRSLSDIRRIVELEEEAYRLRKHNNDMGAEYSSLERHYKRIAEDEKHRAEAAEKRVDDLHVQAERLLKESDSYAKRLAEVERELEDERMISMKRFVETGRADKFAIEQQIKVLEELSTISGAVANHWCEREQAGYMWCHSQITEKLEQLRQQLNGEQP